MPVFRVYCQFYFVYITVVAATGEAGEFLTFVLMYPDVLWHLALLALCGCIGQVNVLCFHLFILNYHHNLF